MTPPTEGGGVPQYALSIDMSREVEELSDNALAVQPPLILLEIAHEGKTVLRVSGDRLDLIGSDSQRVVREMMDKANESDRLRAIAVSLRDALRHEDDTQVLLELLIEADAVLGSDQRCSTCNRLADDPAGDSSTDG